MKKGELLTVFGALWLAACSPGEPGQVATAEDDIPVSGGSVTLAPTPPWASTRGIGSDATSVKRSYEKRPTPWSLQE